MTPIEWEPRYLHLPAKLADVPTAWKGCEMILHDLISRLCPDATKALEIGVDYGYSTVALSNYFASVVGVDTFEGDVHAGHREAQYEMVRNNLLAYPNIRLVRSTYQDFFKGLQRYAGFPRPQFDLAHVDIVHTYDDTVSCVSQALEFSRVVIVHDTRSFPEVLRALCDLADYNKHINNFFEWPKCHGIGILAR